ncbi:MAG: hypothetical protein NTZ53_11450 [Cyanobacteria bacterium]|nr:hypothetical protein [Cyanobacteriota bacterium]
MGTFLWVLEFSGLGITLVGLGREHLLRARALRLGRAAVGAAPVAKPL